MSTDAVTAGKKRRAGEADIALIVAEQLRYRVSGGIGTYIRGLSAGMITQGARVELLSSRGPTLSIDLNQRQLKLPSVLARPMWQSGALGAPADVELIHATSLQTLRASQPQTVFVHDLLWREFPDTFTRRGIRWHESALKKALKRCDTFLVPSERTAHVLADTGLDESQITVIEEGCDHLAEPDVKALDRLYPPRNLVLSVSTLEPRKNLERLIEAFDQARDKLGADCELWIVGPAGWGPHQTAKPGVRLLGKVDDGLLAALYQRAAVLTFVPLAEGFGLPVAEAMRAGCPVISSDVPAAGAASLLVKPKDVEGISKAITDVVSDSGLRAELRAKGRKHAEPLTWSDAARAHIDVWRELGVEVSGAGT